jgi:hypothetical protein
MFAEWLQKECQDGDKAKRLGKPVTPYAIAQSTGLCAGNVWRIYRKEIVNPRWEYMKKIAEYFDTPLWVVVKEIEEGLV